jgi:hypothetical protein
MALAAFATVSPPCYGELQRAVVDFLILIRKFTTGERVFLAISPEYYLIGDVYTSCGC